MKVVTDNNIFVLQQFGGISRLFQDYLEQGLIKEKLNVPNSTNDLTLTRKILNHTNKYLAKDKYYHQKDYLAKQFKESKMDLFHPTYYGDYFLDKLNKPFVITVYDMIHEIYPEIFNINDLIIEKRRVISKAKRIIAISERTKEDILKFLDVPEDKIDVIPLYTKFDSVKPDNLGFDINYPYILFVGNRNYYKNFKRFADSVFPVLKKHNDLRVICTGGEFTEPEKNFFREMAFEDRFVHVKCENDSKLKWLYENALIFIFPSMYEGFGFPVLEAFASSCPVVCSNGGSLQEVGGDACLFFDPHNVHDMQEKIMYCIGNSSERNIMVKRGLKSLKKYSLNKTLTLTKETYVKALS
jgi:glycosyltransferase involved in cell wall biosynthesis